MMKSYIKTLILFPLILQLLATLALWTLGRDLDDDPSLHHYALTAFILATIPAFLTALLAAKFRYLRHHIAAIVMVSAFIAFFYCNIASYFLLIFMDNAEGTFWQWMTGGGLSLGLISTCAMTFYALFVMPWLLPKSR